MSEVGGPDQTETSKDDQQQTQSSEGNVATAPLKEFLANPTSSSQPVSEDFYSRRFDKNGMKRAVGQVMETVPGLKDEALRGELTAVDKKKMESLLRKNRFNDILQRITKRAQGMFGRKAEVGNAIADEYTKQLKTYNMNNKPESQTPPTQKPPSTPSK